MTGGQAAAVELALRLFTRCESITIAGTTCSGEGGTMTIDSGGAFAFEGNPEDMIAATQEAGTEAPRQNSRRSPRASRGELNL